MITKTVEKKPRIYVLVIRLHKKTKENCGNKQKKLWEQIEKKTVKMMEEKKDKKKKEYKKPEMRCIAMRETLMQAGSVEATGVGEDFLPWDEN